MSSAAEEIAALRGTKRATLRDLLRHPFFSRMWRAMLVSSLGDWVGFVAVASLVARIGGARVGALAVAGVMLARLLPSVLFGPFAGVIVDRFDRRKAMIVADITRGVMYASMPFLAQLGPILALSFAIECLSLLWTPARDAIIPNLVPRRQLSNANSVSLGTTYGTLPLGATMYTALAGVSVAVGARVAYFRGRPEFLALWLDAFTFFFSARMIWGLRTPAAPPRTRGARGGQFSPRAALDDVRDGFRFLRENSLVRAMTLGIVIAFAGAGSVISLGPVFARYSVHAGNTGFGILMIALGIGMAVGMASLNRLTRWMEKDFIFSTAILAAAASLILLAAMPTISLAALLTVPMGAAAGLAWVAGYTMLQENVSDEFRGRTFATLTMTARMALFVALAGFPALAAAVGNHTAHVGEELLAIRGERVAIWFGALFVVLAGILSRRSLKRTKLARARPLSLRPRHRRQEGSGRLIVFEGVEGAGKGTQIELAKDYLESRGLDTIVTREPGGTELGDRLRATILDPTTGKMDARAEALLFAASRAQLVSSVIRPALAENKIVLCDRFVDSSIAYQGFGRGLGEQDVLTLNAWATQGLFPDLVLLLHVEPEVGLARGVRDRDRIESEDYTFHARVAEAYLRIAEEHPERFIVIDAARPEEEVHEDVRAALDRLLSNHESDARGK